MPLEAMTTYTSSDDSPASFSSGNESDFDDVPHSKEKVPLRDQFTALKPVTNAVKIDWVPSLSVYQQRVLRRAKERNPLVALPQGFPESVADNAAPCWTGEQVKVRDLIYHLSQEEVHEINQALLHFQGLDLSKDEIRRETFPLPTLTTKLEKISQDIHYGRGVAILRGLQPSEYSREERVIVYAGIASYIGDVRGKQDNDGNVLVHIKDVGSQVAPDNLRQSPYAKNAQPFHTDLGDIIGLFCVDKAMVGGMSKLAPTATVYNDLAACRPDLIDELAAPAWAFAKHDGTEQYMKRPILFYDAVAKRAFFCFSRRQLTGSAVSPRPSYLPPLTEAQAEALDAVHFTANKHALDVQLEKGDMQFSNNLALFHAREAFQDGPDSNKRHMIRMWLRNERHAWTTPAELRDVWAEIYGGTQKPVWYTFPDHNRAHVINRAKSCHG